MGDDSADRSDVLIVGAGPVGLLLACELGRRGIRTRVLEQQTTLILHPKANTHGARSMEIYRRLGLAKALRTVGLPQDRPTDIAYFVRLFGRELHRVPMPSSADARRATRRGDPRWPTPEPQLRTSQMALEPLLLAHARSFESVSILFGAHVEQVVAERDEVRVHLAGEMRGRQEFVAQYLVGCDGGRSTVRRQLGIGFVGHDSLEADFLGGPMQATYFRAPDLLRGFPHRPAWMHWIMHPKGRAILVLIDPRKGEFLMHYQRPLGGPAPDFGERLAAAVGEPIDHEVLSTDEWRAGIGVVASTFRRGHVFIAGDAAHLFTPTGGFGLNTGIEDAFNLGWKLALACRGVAGERLLDSYDAERRPIAIRNTRFALDLAAKAGTTPISNELDAEGIEGDAAREQTAAHLRANAWREFDTPGIQLGGRYDDSPIISFEPAAQRVDLPLEYIPDPSPGGRLPHFWLADGKALFDVLGPEFTLLTLAAHMDVRRWIEAAARLGIGLRIVPLHTEPMAAMLYRADLLLVRPDLYVAWRGAVDEDPGKVLARANGITSENDTRPQESGPP